MVEKWNPFAKIRQDLFGWIDIVAVGQGHILGVQTTTAPNMSARLKKAKGNEALRKWLRGGGVLIIHGWKKIKGEWDFIYRVINDGDL